MAPRGCKPLRGRGALSNPAGRFQRQQVEQIQDGWYVEEQPDTVATTVEPDRAKAIITRNDSPDIPFEYSINPYRGCEHGCVYCLAGDTAVLMADGTTRELAQIRVGDALYGTASRGGYRTYVQTRVLAHWSVIKPAYCITLQDGTRLVAGENHRFLTGRGWQFVTGSPCGAAPRSCLSVGTRLVGTGAFCVPPPKNADYRSGYLFGLLRGDGVLRNPLQTRLSLALGDADTLARARSWWPQEALASTQLAAGSASASGRPMQPIDAGARLQAERVRAAIAWPARVSRSWRAGFLAGIFDATGRCNDSTLCISSSDPQIIRRIGESLRDLAFEFVLERGAPAVRRSLPAIRLVGGLRERLRFFHSVDPANSSKRAITGQALRSSPRLAVVAVEPLGRAMRLYDITTGTEDFIANGVVSHNCYARPSHAYMGLSSGLDFETRLFYKANAGKLLEQELAKPGYVCKSITLGANTDPYQPVERNLRVTRGILEVLARTRHPVSIITKSALVLRDLDLLTDLARDHLVSVAISITSLDAAVKRTLEPRAASPAARLRALRELNDAGVPAGVMVAPVIPALTDHEMEAILQAAAAGGARWAGYVLLRLPYEVKDLFSDWLAQHFPDRAAHVMSLLRAMRDGQENDPNFGSRMRGTGPIAQLLRARFKIACQRLQLNSGSRELPHQTHLFRPPLLEGGQYHLDL